VEREGRLHATDSLESALSFVDALDYRIMTSTAPRLSVVQCEIESVEAALKRILRWRLQQLFETSEETGLLARPNHTRLHTL